MLEFLKSNIANIVVVLLAVMAMIIAVRFGYINKVKQVLLYLVTEAERIYGGKTGEIKFAWVAEKIYSMLPTIVKMFISTETIEMLINKAVEDMKEYLSSNNNAAKYIQGEQQDENRH